MHKLSQKIITKHLENITSIRKNIKRLLTGEEKILRLSFKNITLSFGIITLSLIGLFFSGMVFSNSVLAESVDYSVTVRPSLSVSIPSSDIVLNLNPSNHTFDYKDVAIEVGTNNPTGYKLTLESTSNNLIRQNSEDNIDSTIEPLPELAEGYTEDNFIVNKWGYQMNGSNYLPFTSGLLLSSSDTATNTITTNLRFAAKIDYKQPSGAYATTLNFNAVANPLISIDTLTYMQDFATLTEEDRTAVLASMADETNYTLKDKRDEKTYTFARLKDGQVWMTSNLNLAGGTKLYSETSDVPAGYSESAGVGYYTLPNSSASGFSSATTAYVYNSGNITTSQSDCTSSKPCNSYYSWLAATVGGKDASGNAVTGNGQDTAYSICPAGWRLPKSGNNGDTSITSTTGYKKGDFYKLATAYGANLESSSVQNSAAFYNNAGPGTIPNFLLAGRYGGGSFTYGGSYGNYWSSSSGASTNSYNLYFYSSYMNSASNSNWANGFSVRCVLKES